MVMRFTTPAHNDTWMQPKKVGDRVFHFITGRQGTVIAFPPWEEYITVQFDVKQRRGVHKRGGKTDGGVENRSTDVFLIGENGLPEE